MTTVQGLHHTIRRSDHWLPLGDVAGQIQVPGPVRTMGAAGADNGDVHFIFATEDGRLWHTIRFANGSWQPVGDVTRHIQVPGAVRTVTAARGVNGDIHFMFATDDHLWHTIRYANGSWQSLGDVAGQIHVPGPVRLVAAAGTDNGDMHFMVATGAPASPPATTAVTTSTASPDGLVDIHIQIRSPRHD
ncbi:MAG: hypothetical protein ABW000_19985 [Actinoplanes sp.]